MNRGQFAGGFSKLATVVIVAAPIAAAAYIALYAPFLPPAKYWFREPKNFMECIEATRAARTKVLPEWCAFREKEFIEGTEQEKSQADAGMPNQQMVIDTKNWQTYRNEEYGFEIMYPGEWDMPLEIPADKGKWIEFRKLPSPATASKISLKLNLSVSHSYGQLGLEKISARDVVVSSEKAYFYVLKKQDKICKNKITQSAILDCENWRSINYDFVHNEVNYNFAVLSSASELSSDISISENILSTFEFTN